MQLICNIEKKVLIKHAVDFFSNFWLSKTTWPNDSLHTVHVIIIKRIKCGCHVGLFFDDRLSLCGLLEQETLSCQLLMNPQSMFMCLIFFHASGYLCTSGKSLRWAPKTQRAHCMAGCAPCSLSTCYSYIWGLKQTWDEIYLLAPGSHPSPPSPPSAQQQTRHADS